MKKIISIILAFALCATFLVACGNSSTKSDANSGSNAVAKENDKTENSIVGTWTGDEAGETVTYTFKANGTFSASYISGTYSIAEGKITLTADLNGQEIKLFDNVAFSINGNTLQMGEYTYTKK